MSTDLNTVLDFYRTELRQKLIELIKQDSEFMKVVSMITSASQEMPADIIKLAGLIEDLTYAMDKFNSDFNNQPEE